MWTEFIWHRKRPSRVLVNKIFKFQAAEQKRDFTTGLTTIGFSKETRIHGSMLYPCTMSALSIHSLEMLGEPMLNLMYVDPCIIVQLVKKNRTRCDSISEFIIPYLYEAQHVSGNTPPIIRSLHTLSDSAQQLHIQQPSTHAKAEGARAVLGSWWWTVCRPKHVELHINMK